MRSRSRAALVIARSASDEAIQHSLSATVSRPVEFVFKYGLALIAMGLLDNAKKTAEWSANEVEVRERISKSAAGVGRVIVPLCLTLPKKLPKAA